MPSRIGRVGILLATLALTACVPATPSPIAPPTLTPVPPSPTPSAPIILFDDDFSDPASGWGTLEDEDGVIAYQDGGLAFRNEGLGRTLLTSPGLVAADVVIEVSVTWLDGTQDNWMGIACRMQENSDAYALLISADGFFLIARFSDGEPLDLDGPAPSQDIRTGEATNSLRAVCSGETLQLWVNEVLLSERTDAAFLTGEVGLLVDSLDETATEVLFDDFVVFEP